MVVGEVFRDTYFSSYERTSYKEHTDKYVQNAGMLSVLSRQNVEEREGFPNQRAEDTVGHLSRQCAIQADSRE